MKRLPIIAASLLLLATPASAETGSGARDSDQQTSLGSLLVGFGATTALVSYGLNVAVSLTSGRDCVGPKCDERYFSFVPVVGGLVQFAYAGVEFHRRWHGPMCLPLTIASVAGQVVGLGAVIAGLIVRVRERAARRGLLQRVASGSLSVGGTVSAGGASFSVGGRF